MVALRTETLWVRVLWLFHYHITTLGKWFTHTHTHISASVTKQYNFVLGKQRRCTVVGKITAGLVYGNGSLLLGLWYGIVEFNVQLDTL